MFGTFATAWNITFTAAIVLVVCLLSHRVPGGDHCIIRELF